MASVQSVVYNPLEENWLITLTGEAQEGDVYNVLVKHTEKDSVTVQGPSLVPSFTGAYYDSVSSKIVFTSYGSRYYGITSFIATLAPATTVFPEEFPGAIRTNKPLSGTITLTVGGVSGSYDYDYSLSEAIGTEAPPEPAPLTRSNELTEPEPNAIAYDYSEQLNRAVVAIERLTLINETIANALARIATESVSSSTRQLEISNSLANMANDIEAIRISLYGTGYLTIVVTDPGDGYLVAPNVSVESPAGTSYIVDAVASVANGEISDITITEPSSKLKYNSIPAVELSPPSIVSDTPVEFAANLEVESNDYVVYNRIYYRVKDLGNPRYTLGSIGPTHTSGSANNGTAILDYVGRHAVVSANIGNVANNSGKTVNPYDLIKTASLYAYYIKNPDETTLILDALEGKTSNGELERIRRLAELSKQFPTFP